MRDILIKSKINMNTFTHIEPVLINNGGLYAENTPWLDAILDHETSAKTVVLWQVGDSFLQSGGLAKDLLDHNKWYKDYICSKEVAINGSVVERLTHEFILMPLAYTMQKEKSTRHKLETSKAFDIVPGHVYAKFEVYNLLARMENEKNYPNQLEGLPDPSLLAVRQQTFNRRIFGANRPCNTDVFTARSATHGFELLLRDRQNMSFMVELQKWLRDNFYEQTMQVLSSSPNHGMQPAKKQKLN